MQSFILIHPTIWPQYTNITDRTDRQRRANRFKNDRPKRGQSRPIFGLCLLQPNGCMDQDATWYWV